jgi:hypothetical protein
MIKKLNKVDSSMVYAVSLPENIQTRLIDAKAYLQKHL